MGLKTNWSNNLRRDSPRTQHPVLLLRTLYGVITKYCCTFDQAGLTIYDVDSGGTRSAGRLVGRLPLTVVKVEPTLHNHRMDNGFG
jgi:hypothetical protein